MNTLHRMSLATAAVLLTLSACAQTGPRGDAGMGPGMGPGMMGQGQGMGPGMHGYRFDDDNTAGWAMMTEQERAEHREKMMSVRSYEECMAYAAEHHKTMQERAAAQGQTMPAPRFNACERMREMGMFR